MWNAVEECCSLNLPFYSSLPLFSVIFTHVYSPCGGDITFSFVNLLFEVARPVKRHEKA